MATVIKFPDQAPEDYLYALDDKFVGCKGQGHNFPKLKRGRQPKNVKAVPQHDGSYQLEFRCPDCGTKRTLTTLPGGQFDLPAVYRYIYPAGYQAPKGSGLTRRDYFRETWRRFTEELVAQAQHEQTQDDVPEVKFSS